MDSHSIMRVAQEVISASIHDSWIHRAGSNASVTARAAISPGPSPLQWREDRGHSLPDFASVNQAQSQTSELADGLYTVTGSLSSLAGFSGCACIAFSTFLGGIDNPVGSFQVNVAASPLPEPSSCLLLATGLLGVAWARRNWPVFACKTWQKPMTSLRTNTP